VKRGDYVTTQGIVDGMVSKIIETSSKVDLKDGELYTVPRDSDEVIRFNFHGGAVPDKIQFFVGLDMVGEMSDLGEVNRVPFEWRQGNTRINAYPKFILSKHTLRVRPIGKDCTMSFANVFYDGAIRDFHIKAKAKTTVTCGEKLVYASAPPLLAKIGRFPASKL
jgi:hypothetical protein